MEYAQITGVCVTCAGSIMAYGVFRCNRKTTFKDPLTIALAPPPFDKFADGWAILHFCFYATLAYIYPQSGTLAYIWCLGVTWEIIETSAKDHPFYISKNSYAFQKNSEMACWWYGRWQDVVMNSAGMLLGWYISQLP